MPIEEVLSNPSSTSSSSVNDPSYNDSNHPGNNNNNNKKNNHAIVGSYNSPEKAFPSQEEDSILYNGSGSMINDILSILAEETEMMMNTDQPKVSKNLITHSMRARISNYPIIHPRFNCF